MQQQPAGPRATPHVWNGATQGPAHGSTRGEARGAVHVTCPHGGIRFDVAGNWEQQCRTANIVAENINEEVQGCRRIKARRIVAPFASTVAQCAELCKINVKLI